MPLGGIMKAWQEHWSSGSKARLTYSLLEKVDHKRMNGDFFLNQDFTGHGVFPSHQARFLGKDPQCPCGRGEGPVFYALLPIHPCRL
ncbi:hypothetical protein AVEN_128696-1 [Araneus ventricosus]|uniref:Uncharacterized protein n=1 Tax=Araneus ventricosus TaxID=182803 RepID=A0A4Y2P4Y0_ARAVE|nr:hypothetical protein AVEN_236925-1 [Araneus ventricosus]GBN46975.1 hypothetical protein AVEN_128696-1 [Araneus ventricosus]